MRLVWLCLLCCAANIAVAMAAPTPPEPMDQGQAEDTEPLPPPGTDPFVLLDEAKTAMGNGKLRRAADLLAAIPPDAPVEPYVSEEILLQRMLLSGAFMKAAGAVHNDAVKAKYATSTYAGWLRTEHARYAHEFAGLAGQYLERTADGLDCDFIRFRLPRVTVEHLKDIALYADPQVLRAATENWEEQKTGLGNGLIASQSRVALVLEAAAFYDLSEASATIEGVAGRLRNGVPLTMPVLLDWLAQTAAEEGRTTKAILDPIKATADTRLMPLIASDSVLTDRFNRRNGLVVEVKPEAPKPKPKKRSNKRRR